MIRETRNERDDPMLTSDRWHVLRARWTGEDRSAPLFRRTIESEHEDRDAATLAAREIVAAFAPEMSGRVRETRDQVLVRRPGRRTLAIGRRTGSGKS